MRDKHFVITMTALAVLCHASCGFAQSASLPPAPPPTVATVGELADVTADLVVMSAQADRTQARVKAGVNDDGTPIKEDASNADGIATGVPSIEGASKVGGITYADLRYDDGSVSSVAAPITLPGGYSVQPTADGASLVDASGHVVSEYPRAAAANSNAAQPPRQLVRVSSISPALQAPPTTPIAAPINQLQRPVQ